MNQVHSPEVSIITPTKNRLKLLCEAIDSLKQQTLVDWEHVIVDDGSDDGSREKVLAIAQEDPRVRFFERSSDSAGANVCRNQGLEEARSDLVIFLDSDDLLKPDCLERRVAIMKANSDLDFAAFQASTFQDVPGDLTQGFSSDLLGDDLLRFLTFDFPWIISGPIWRASSLRRLGGFDRELLSWQDIDLHVRSIVGGFRYLKFSERDHHVRWQYEEKKTSIEQRRSPRHLIGALALLKKFKVLIHEGPGMNWVRQRALCGLYFFLAERWLELGDKAAALRAWRHIKTEGIGTPFLLFTGSLLLVTGAAKHDGTVGARLTHKWKGWMRLRNNPELVPA